jgi:YD repeat-containing protein
MVRFWAGFLAIAMGGQISAQELPLNPSYPIPFEQGQAPATRNPPDLTVTMSTATATESAFPIGSGSELDPVSQDDRRARASVSSLPGESVDERTGEVTFSMVDFALKGVGGLDVSVGRTRRNWFWKSKATRHKYERQEMDTMSDWRLDIPHIRIMRTSQSAYRIFKSDGTVDAGLTSIYGGLCGLLIPPESFWGDTLLNSQIMKWRAPEIAGFTGVQAKPMMHTNRLSPSSHPLLAGAAYVTPDQWRITCAASQYNATKISKFIAAAPDGTVYEFDEPSLGSQDATYPPANDSTAFFRLYPTYLRVYVSKITDRNGNWISFQYKNLRPAAERDLQDFAYIESITTSDGRSITFDWARNPACASDTSCSTVQDMPKLFMPSYLLRSFSHDGRTWRYAYEGFDLELTKVTLPDGSAWNYDLQHFDDRLTSLYSITYPKRGRALYLFYPRIEKLPGPSWVTYQSLDTKAYQLFDKEDDVEAPGTTYDTAYCYLPFQNSPSVPVRRLIVERNACSVLDAGCASNTAHRSRLLTFQNQVLEGSDPNRHVRWDEGLLLKEQVYKGSLLTSSLFCPDLPSSGEFSSSALLETRTATWTKLPLELAAMQFSPGLTGDFYYSDAARHWRVVEKQTTTRTNWGSFETLFQDHDTFGFAGTTRESLAGQSATATTARISSQSYRHMTGSPWVIGLPENGAVSHQGTTLSTSSNAYDAKGQLQTATTDGVTLSYTYTPGGDVATITDARQQTLILSAYKLGVPQAVTFPGTAGERETYIVSNRGTVTQVTNARGKSTVFGYDDLDRLKTAAFPVGDPLSIVWSPDGRTKTLTRGRRIDSNSFDGFGRLVSESVQDSLLPADTVVSTLRYDGFGLLRFQSYPGSSAPGVDGLEHDYDALGRSTITRRTADGKSSSTSYLPGETKSITDYAGRNRTVVYRGFGGPGEDQVMQTSIPYTKRNADGTGTAASMTTTVVRDAMGFATGVTQGDVSRRYKLDARRFITSEFSPELGPPAINGLYNVSYCRDPAGNIEGKSIGTICASKDSANLIQILYDARGRVDLVHYRDEPNDVDYQYTPTGNVERVTKGGTRLSYEYDDADRLRFETHEIDGYVFRVGFRRDGLDNVDAVTYPSGKTYSHSPDAFGRPRAIAGVLNNVSYWPSGAVKQMVYANGQVTNVALTARIETDTLRTERAGISVVDLDYDYDASGNVTTVIDSMRPGDTQVLEYDELDRLISTSYAIASGVKHRRGYDGTGNVSFDQSPEYSLTFAYDPATNRLNSVTGGASRNIGYDWLGNIVSDGVRSQMFARDGNLTQSLTPVVKQFDYDGRDRMIKEDGPNGVRYMVYSGENLLLEYEPQKDSYTENLYLGSMLVGSRHVDHASNMDSDGDGVTDDLEFHGLGQ